jgi:DnaJ-class molecular chaperone
MGLVGTVVAFVLLGLALLAVWWAAREARRRYGRPRGFRRGPSVTVVCVQCRGSGWIDRRERTLQFTGDGFADVQNPSTMCPACGGTGQRTR